jgi:hypothetical protein
MVKCLMVDKLPGCARDAATASVEAVKTDGNQLFYSAKFCGFLFGKTGLNS